MDVYGVITVFDALFGCMLNMIMIFKDFLPLDALVAHRHSHATIPATKVSPPHCFEIASHRFRNHIIHGTKILHDLRKGSLKDISLFPLDATYYICIGH
jgi:hypothetical protein